MVRERRRKSDGGGKKEIDRNGKVSQRINQYIVEVKTKRQIL